MYHIYISYIYILRGVRKKKKKRLPLCRLCTTFSIGSISFLLSRNHRGSPVCLHRSPEISGHLWRYFWNHPEREKHSEEQKNDQNVTTNLNKEIITLCWNGLQCVCVRFYMLIFTWYQGTYSRSIKKMIKYYIQETLHVQKRGKMRPRFHHFLRRWLRLVAWWMSLEIGPSMTRGG